VREADVSGGSEDRVRVSTTVAVDRTEAFRIFTEEVDAWWRRGSRYRVAGRRPGVLCLEPRVGGRLFEVLETDGGSRVFEMGRVTAWEPPARLAFEWRAVNFAPCERTFVEVTFEPAGESTRVTVVHSGWEGIRPDHPARHGHPPAPFLRTMGLWWGELLTGLREHVPEGS
jgi:uncharacterized protein YndB with AHSA1/START domain